jgi:D-lactate dehydrogenase
MKIFVYTLRKDEEPFFAQFGERYGVSLALHREDPTEETAALAEGFPVMSICTTPLNAEVLRRLYQKGIRFVSTRSIGYDHIDMAAAKELGIHIGNVSYAPDSVSNYTVMLMLMALRRIKNISLLAKAQDFSLGAGVQGRNLNELCVGIAGTGRIGRRVIEHLQGFGCKILSFDQFHAPEVEKMAAYVEWDELLAKSDIISLHMSPSDANFHLINAETIAKMKDGVIIVNNARGSLINTGDFIAAVESGKIGAAALDVHENEANLYYRDLRGAVLPNRDVAILRSFPNVILTPHTAFYTDRTVSDMVENSIKSCIAFQQGLENPWQIA